MGRIHVRDDNLREPVNGAELRDLRLVASRNIAQHPARLLQDVLLGPHREQLGRHLQYSGVDGGLGLRVGAAHDVAERAKRRHHNLGVVHGNGAHEERHDARGHHRLNAGVVAIAHIAQRPARVHEHVRVLASLEQPLEHGHGRRYSVEVRRRLAAAAVAEGPRGVAQQRGRRRVHDVDKQRLQRIVLEHEVAEPRRVTGDVTEAPGGLLAHVGCIVHEQLDERLDGPAVDDDVRVVRGRDVRQRPGGLEEQLRVVDDAEEGAELGQHAGLHHLQHGRLALGAQEAAEGANGRPHDDGIAAVELRGVPGDVAGHGPEFGARGGHGRGGHAIRGRRRRHIGHHRAALLEALFALVLADAHARLTAAAARIRLGHALLKVGLTPLHLGLGC
mmetsp:Transcript_45623/g.142819  ORF Transcript_45623/g.142819 Transcript_45623/m.142819 type:complete len:389 (-) Transcript_45623:58-1224(-)